MGNRERETGFLGMEPQFPATWQSRRALLALQAIGQYSGLLVHGLSRTAFV